MYVCMYVMKGYVTKEEYAGTLRVYQKRVDEMKSDTRDEAAKAEWSRG